MEKQFTDSIHRFEDYIGNPLRAVETYIELADDDILLEKKQQYEEQAREAWTELFQRIRTFLEQNHEEMLNLTHENISALLEYEHKDPFDPEVLSEVSRIFDLIRGKNA